MIAHMLHSEKMRSFERITTTLCVGLLVFIATHPLVFAQSSDTTPPDITNVQVEPLSETSVKIIWNTDEDADSLVNYGLSEDYGIVRVPVAERQEHEITLEGLEPGRTYHFRVVSSDEDGNQGISADYKVLTQGTPQLGPGEGVSPNLEENITLQSGTGPSGNESNTGTTTEVQIAEQVVEQIQQIQNPQVLQEVLEETVIQIQSVTEELDIVGPPTVIPETTTALVRWATNRPANSTVFFSPASTYVPGQYEFSQSSTGADTTDHEVNLIGLEPFTEYHFKVVSTDSAGLSGESLDFTFKTKAALPEIRNLRIVKVEEDSATLAWDTTVPAKATIEYQDLTTGDQNSIGRPTLASTHQMRIPDLTLGSRYVAFVIAENAGGDRVKSNPITFITRRDTAAPIISNVTNESTLFPGSEARIQTIIEWDTDEPSYCLLSFREGVAGGVEPTILEPEDQSYTERHVEVIIDFAPATVYQFWLTCADEQGNSVDSENFVLFTPIQEKNIIDIIIENFESTFGWVKNIGG